MGQEESQIVKAAQTRVDLSNVVLKTIELRLAAVREATQRSRFVFIVMTIMTSTILIGLWNAVLSWDRGMAFRKQGLSAIVGKNQEFVAGEWFKNLFVSVGVLGIRISTNDMAVIGSVSLIVIMVWFFFSQRRENRAIVSLLRDCGKKAEKGELDKDACELVYEGIVQSIVFSDLGGGDKPIKGLDETPLSSERDRFVRQLLKFLMFLPPITIAMILVADVSSIFLPSYLREDNRVLWRVLYENRLFLEIGKIIVFECIAVSALLYTWQLCNGCIDFAQATSETIRDFQVAFCKDKQDLGKIPELKRSVLVAAREWLRARTTQVTSELSDAVSQAPEQPEGQQVNPGSPARNAVDELTF